MTIFASIGWAVVHSLWQIALIYLLAQFVGWTFRKHEQLRYQVLLHAMFMSMALMCFTIWHVLHKSAQVTVSTPELSDEADQLQTSEIAVGTPVANPANPDVWLDSINPDIIMTWIGYLWGIGALLLIVRAFGGWWLTQQIKKQARPIEAVFQEYCNFLSNKTGIRRSVKWLTSDSITEPITMGWLKPVILFPASLHLRLTPEELESVLLHELAHIRRYDYLLNLFQIMVETCLFYHPLIWMMSREIRRRREYCCDDLVLKAGSNKLIYAQTLTNIQLTQSHTQHIFLAMKSIGKSPFAIRIMRIAGITPKESPRVQLVLPGLFLLGICFSISVSTASGALPEMAESWQQVITPDTITPKPATTPRPAKTAIPLNATPTPRPAPTPLPSAASPDNDNQPAPTPKAISPDLGAPVAVEAEKMNVLYIGVDNPLIVSVAENQSKQPISVKLSRNGTVKMTPEGNYTAIVTQPGQTEVQVFVGEKMIYSKPYRIKRIPDPMPMLGTYRSGSYAKEELLSNPEIKAIMANFDFDAVCEVTYFEVTFMPQGSNPQSTVTVNGSRLPDALIKAIRETTNAGTNALFIDNIKVKCPGDATARHLGGLAFKF